MNFFKKLTTRQQKQPELEKLPFAETIAKHAPSPSDVAHALRRKPEGFTLESARSLITGKKVLVVDDEFNARFLIMGVFGDLGAITEGADCVQKAVECAKREKYDILIFDHDIIGGLGTDAAREIRNAYSQVGHSPIFLSHSGSAEAVLKIPDSKELFTDFSEKPDYAACVSRAAEALSKKE